MLAVGDAGAGAHALHLARADDRAVAQAVLVLQRAFQHVADDLHVAMRMGGKTCAGGDAILIEDAQAGKAHLRRVVILVEGRGVPAVEPIQLGVAEFLALANCNHALPLTLGPLAPIARQTIPAQLGCHAPGVLSRFALRHARL